MSGYLIEFKGSPITIKLETLDTILVVHVSSGQDKPYSCSSGFYIRVGLNAQKMSRNQIIEFFQSEDQIRVEELMNLNFDVQTDFDPDKLNHFLELSGISKVLDTQAVLLNLGVAEKQISTDILYKRGFTKILIRIIIVVFKITFRLKSFFDSFSGC